MYIKGAAENIHGRNKYFPVPDLDLVLHFRKSDVAQFFHLDERSQRQHGFEVVELSVLYTHIRHGMERICIETVFMPHRLQGNVSCDFAFQVFICEGRLIEIIKLIKEPREIELLQ